MSTIMTLTEERETTHQPMTSWWEQFQRSQPHGGFRTIYLTWEQRRRDTSTDSGLSGLRKSA
jgi:hypothetical protein